MDLTMLRFLTQLRGRMPALDALVENLAGNDLVKGGLVFALLWWFFSRPHPEQARRREIVIGCLFAALVACTASRITTRLFYLHPRPFLVHGLNLQLALTVPWDDKGGSFPSDHAAMGFALAAGVFFISRRLGLALIAYVLVLVCLPRIYLGMHWPSDILAGAALGGAASSVICQKRIRSAVAGPILKLHAESPAAFCVVALLMSYGIMTRFDNVRSLASWSVNAVRLPTPEVQTSQPAPHLSQLQLPGRAAARIPLSPASSEGFPEPGP